MNRRSRTTSIAPTDYDETVSKVDAAITPLRWGRFVTSVTRTVTVTTQPGDTHFHCPHRPHHHRRAEDQGALRHRRYRPRSQRTFQDTSAKNVVFKRVARETKRYWLNWLPVATSLVSGGTGPAPANEAILITRLELSAGGNTVTVTDPLATWLRYRWLKMFNGGEVTMSRS